MSNVLAYKGVLRGHGDMVTSISTATGDDCGLVLSTSRDKSLMVWKMDSPDNQMSDIKYAGKPVKRLEGHGQAVADGALSSACGGERFAVSGSWDSYMKLWDLDKGCEMRMFKGHTSDVLSVTFSIDSRQIVSGSRDKTIRVWNTKAECKYTSAVGATGHEDWVSCVRFCPHRHPTVVSTSWDKTVKVWSFSNWEVKTSFTGHEGAVHTVTVSPDGSLCATGGKDSTCNLWDLNSEKNVYSFDTKVAKNGNVNGLCFSPSDYWLCAAMDRSITIWELEGKKLACDVTLSTQDSEIADLVDHDNHLTSIDIAERPYSKTLPFATCIEWDQFGSTMFVGTSNGDIHCFNRARKDSGDAAY